MKKGTLLMMLFLSFSSVLLGQEKTKPYDDSDVYKVYDVIIRNEWPISVAKATRLVLQAETTTIPGFGENKLCLKPAPGDEPTLGPLLASYTKANEKPWVLQKNFKLDIPYEIVPRSELDKIFAPNSDGWKPFNTKYPNSGGFIHMSAVGFNADKTLALVYMGHLCGGLCGGGTHHLLEKREGKWIEIPWRGETCMWAS